MSEPPSDDARLAAEIERLKAQFPKTRELYREVCALLFFRFGITPTANRLYQLVHRGSMGTPTAVLSEFWAELREKSRVRIEHPDLPVEVRDAAGELVATLWSRATAAANAALDGLRTDVQAQQREAQESARRRDADLARTETALEQRTAALLAAQVRIHELEQALVLADERAALDVERERAGLAQSLADARAEIQALYAQLGDLRHTNGTLEGQLQALRELNAGASPRTGKSKGKSGSRSGGSGPRSGSQ